MQPNREIQEAHDYVLCKFAEVSSLLEHHSSFLVRKEPKTYPNGHQTLTKKGCLVLGGDLQVCVVPKISNTERVILAWSFLMSEIWHPRQRPASSVHMPTQNFHDKNDPVILPVPDARNLWKAHSWTEISSLLNTKRPRPAQRNEWKFSCLMFATWGVNIWIDRIN